MNLIIVIIRCQSIILSFIFGYDFIEVKLIYNVVLILDV